jgi:hypothetical protein
MKNYKPKILSPGILIKQRKVLFVTFFSEELKYIPSTDQHHLTSDLEASYFYCVSLYGELDEPRMFTGISFSIIIIKDTCKKTHLLPQTLKNELSVQPNSTNVLCVLMVSCQRDGQYLDEFFPVWTANQHKTLTGGFI